MVRRGGGAGERRRRWGQSQFWGELKPGKYGVGFRSLYQLDVARSYDADYPAPGSTPRQKAPADLPRHLVSRGGAARQRHGLPRLFPRRLVRIRPSPDSPSACASSPATWPASTCSARSSTSSPPRSAPIGTGCSPRRSSPPWTFPPAAGKFPVVIYHPGLGGTFDDNAVACEYLASHGYVVLSSAYEAADSSSLNIDGDLATSLDDLNFLLRYAATLPFADSCQVAAMGHSYGAQAMLAWRRAPNSPLDAVVFLDSTVEYRPLDDIPLSRRRSSAIAIPRRPC